MKEQQQITVFLNAVTPRVGPVNAIALLKDVRTNAILDVLKELGASQESIDNAMEKRIQETAQNIQKMPMPSPYQRV